MYHWEVVLDDMFDNIEAGRLGGVAMSLTLANGGLVIEVNGCYDLSPDMLRGATDVINQIIDGVITPPS